MFAHHPDARELIKVLPERSRRLLGQQRIRARQIAVCERRRSERQTRKAVDFAAGGDQSLSIRNSGVNVAARKLEEECIRDQPVIRQALSGARKGMRRLVDPPYAELIVVAKDDPDAIQWKIDGPIRVANYALPTMVIEIHTYENLAADPSVGYRFNPASGFRSFRSLA